MSNEVTIDVMNEAIARFMGYEKVTVGYFGCDDETEWQRKHAFWMDKVGIESVGDYFVDVANDEWLFCDDVNYDKSWDALMPVVEKIRGMGYHIEITISVHCSVEILKLRGDPEKDVLRIIAYSTPINAIYTAVYQFITWYNDNQQQQNNG